MIFFILMDLLVASFTELSSYFVIIGFVKCQKITSFLLGGLLLSLLLNNYLYLLIFLLFYLLNKWVFKFKIINIKSFILKYLINISIFMLILLIVNGGGYINVLYIILINLIIGCLCYKFIYNDIVINR